MGFDDVLQFPATEDGCIYFYDENRRAWKKICDVSILDLPSSVKNKVREEQNKAERILNLPLKQ